MKKTHSEEYFVRETAIHDANENTILISVL